MNTSRNIINISEYNNTEYNDKIIQNLSNIDEKTDTNVKKTNKYNELLKFIKFSLKSYKNILLCMLIFIIITIILIIIKPDFLLHDKTDKENNNDEKIHYPKLILLSFLISILCIVSYRCYSNI